MAKHLTYIFCHLKAPLHCHYWCTLFAWPRYSNVQKMSEVYSCTIEPVRCNCTLPGASLVLSGNTNPDFLIQRFTI